MTAFIALELQNYMLIRENTMNHQDFSPDFMKEIYLILTGIHTDLSNICQKPYVEELALYTSQVLRDEITQTIQTAIEFTYPNEDHHQLASFAAAMSWSVIGLAYEWKRSKENSPEEYYEQFEDSYQKFFRGFER